MALSQGNLVTWNSTSQPTGLTNMTAQAITGGGGVGIGQEVWAGGFMLSNLHNGSPMTSINTDRYVQFVVNPASGYQINASQFTLRTNWANGAQSRKMEVRVSNNGSSWSSLTDSGAQTVFNVTGSAQLFTLNFPANYTVLPSQTLYVRVYYYDFSNNHYTDTRIQSTYANASTPGPTLRGTVAPAGGVIATNDATSTLQNTAVNINVLSNDVATNTSFGAVTIDTQSANGLATVQADKTITFAPATNYTGTTTFKYKVNGNDGSSQVATVTVTVNPFVAPTANNDSATTNENTPVIINVLQNDTMGSSNTVASIIRSTPANGTTSLTGSNQIIYTPNNGASGSDSFTYTITDGNGKTGTATVNITIIAFIPPTANNDSATTTENQAVTINVLVNDTTGSSSTIVSVSTSTPTKGTTSITADNKVVYTPTTGISGADSFTYTITDGNGKTGTATVNINIIGFVPPTANNDAVTTGQNIPVTVNVLANDTAGQGTITGITITGQPPSGVATINGNRVIYTPTAAFTGNAVITYRVNDSNNKSALATLTVTVVAIVAPTANNDSATTAINNAITLNVTANDTPGNSPITTVAIASNATHGTLAVNNDNTITYTPAANYTGADSFSYTVTNGYHATATATVSINVIQPSATGALCGTYTIGTGGDFATLTAAIARLNQTEGINCPVTFVLNNIMYNSSTESFPLVIGTINGNSQVNTVTFKPAANKNVTIQVNDITVSNNNYQAVAAFILNGTNNIIFDGSNTAGGTTRNLTVTNNNTIGHLHRTVFWVGSGANRVTIKNTNIRQGVKNQGERFCTGVYIGNYDITGTLNSRQMVIAEANAAISNINVVNNDFMNVKQGAYVNGGQNGANATNIVIHQNDLGSENNQETIIQPACINNVNGFEYTENLVYNLYRDNDAGNLISSGIYVIGQSKNGSIQRNNMRDITRTTGTGSAFAGITLNSTDDASNITVANNFILNVTAVASGQPNQNGHGIYVIDGGGYKIYHNTVNLLTNPSGDGYSAALFVGPDVTSLDVRNNIFANNQTNTAVRRCAVLADNVPSVFTSLDYNSYFSNDRIGFIRANGVGGVSDRNSAGYITSFPAWKSTTGKDAHTVEHNPVFVSATDLHLTTGNSAIDNEGIFIAAVPKDIDGVLRSTTKPTIGADEYGEVVAPEPGFDDGVYCSTSTTWSAAGWSNGEPAINKDVIFTANYTQTGGTLYACSMFVEGAAQVNFISNSNAVVVHNVNVKSTASLTFESNSNLVQVENTQNVGNIVVKRNSSKLKRLDYTLWSSPVTGQMLKPFSPATDENRFYYYNTNTDQYTNIGAANIATTQFANGRAYLIRMPNSLPVAGYNAGNTSVVYNGVFTGVPHNGNVRIPLSYGMVNNSQGVAVLRQYNAVGNPYASPISISDFIDANIDNIDGTLYLWRKTNDPTKTSYSTVTKAGYAANNAPGGGGDNGNGGNDLIANPFALNNKGVLNTGQGFIVKALTNKELVFRNNMRVMNNMTTFFRSANAAVQGPVSDINRVWLKVTNATDAFTQTLVAYTPDATENYDNGFDGDALLDGGVTLYSIADAHKLAIQARPAFTINDVVKLGFKTSVAGNFTVAIDSLDGIFTGAQNIYLKDNQSGMLHNLKEGNYTFTTEIGTFESRFEVVYTDAALGVDVPVIAAKDIIVYNNDKKISIHAPQAIKSVTVYDILGKTLYQSNNIDAQEFSTPDINAAQQVLLVSITLDNNQAVTKKIMLK